MSTVARPVEGWAPAETTATDPTEEAHMPQGPWFFCLKHHTVEDRDGCAERHRLGPYDTREEAEHALQSVAERNEQQDEADRKWDGD